MTKLNVSGATNLFTNRYEDLNTPITIPNPPQPPTILTDINNDEYDAQLSAWKAECMSIVLNAQINKIALLFERYEIDTSDESSWSKLTLQLIKDLIPGFSIKIESKPGAKTKWSDVKLAQLNHAVKQTIQNKKRNLGKTISVTHACRILAKEEQWKSMDKSPEARGKTLYNQYMKSQKSPIVETLDKVYKSFTLSGKEDFIREAIIEFNNGLNKEQI
jgi:hypothetical protein